MEDERMARLVAEETAARLKEERLLRRHITLQDISAGVAAGERKELRLVVKADVQGSLEALHTSVLRLANEQVKLAVLHEGVGPVNQSDVALAAASDAVILGFHVGVEPGAEPLIRQEGVEVRRYSVIYEAIEELKKAMEGLLAPKVQEVALGRAEVRATFRTPRGVIAGCFITSGKAVRGERVRVLRNGDILHEGALSSLRRFKEDAREVAQGYECGIAAEGFNEFAVGDLLEIYTRTLVQEKLKI
jgi:translation initiation factor IF-2